MLFLVLNFSLLNITMITSDHSGTIHTLVAGSNASGFKPKERKKKETKRLWSRSRVPVALPRSAFLSELLPGGTFVSLFGENLQGRDSSYIFTPEQRHVWMFKRKNFRHHILLLFSNSCFKKKRKKDFGGYQISTMKSS